MRWPARLSLVASAQDGRTRVHAEHEGPLRLLKTLYPEGPGIAHAVLVHPPGGLVGGDRLAISLDVQPGAHLLATTPAATRFYRTAAGAATQTVQAQVATGARLEWVPQETLAYSGCQGRNELRVTLAPGASLIASELLGLGLPEAGQPFATGSFLQHLEVQGLWLDRGLIDASDHALLHGPCGLAGQRALGSLALVDDGVCEAWLEATRARLSGQLASCTRLHNRLLLVRWLGQDLEPAAALLRQVRNLWRGLAWGLSPLEPRIWAT